MASLDPCIKSPSFFMPPGHFTVDQKYVLKINDYQLFFPQTRGTEVNYCSSLDLGLVSKFPLQSVSPIRKLP